MYLFLIIFIFLLILELNLILVFVLILLIIDICWKFRIMFEDFCDVVKVCIIGCWYLILVKLSFGLFCFEFKLLFKIL